MSAALVSILVGLAASNLGIIPHQAPAYSIVFQYLLPLTLPLLLFRADLQQVIHSTGTLLFAFFIGTGLPLHLFMLHQSSTTIYLVTINILSFSCMTC